jgi:branched-subunit amino acid transport protein AzlD
MRAITLQMVQPGNLFLLALTATACWRARTSIADGSAPALRFWLLALPFVMVGAVAPTPMQVQYLFALFPFAALGMILALPYQTPVRWFSLALGASAVVAAIVAAPRFAEGVAVLPTPSNWYPVKIHQRGLYLATMMAAQVNPGVDDWAFTLSPILPLEGEAPIETRTATGPFGWRIAETISPSERESLGILGAEELDAALADPPPRALLTAMHSDDEANDDAFIESWALANGYVAVPMPDEGTLWLSPLAEWGDIRLGAQTFPTVTVSGATIAGVLYLQSSGQTETNLNLLLRAVDVDGNELFRFDGWPFGSATSTWETEALWQDGHTFALPADATPGNYRLEASFYDPATLETVGEVAPIGWITLSADIGDSAPLANFGSISLLETKPEEITLEPGGEESIELLWRASAPIQQEYTRFAHLVDENGALVMQFDAQPQGGFYPTSQWSADIPVRDAIALKVPDDVAAGAYRLHLGLYDAQSGERLIGADGSDSYQLPVQIGDAGAQQ